MKRMRMMRKMTTLRFILVVVEVGERSSTVSVGRLVGVEVEV